MYLHCKSILTLIFLLLFIFSSTGCAPMHFVNGPIIEDTVKREHWHHIIGVGLIELSEPFDVSYYCDNKEWEKVTVVVNLPNIMASVAAIYTPWSIRYECRSPIE
jgi:hypothetical protein